MSKKKSYEPTKEGFKEVDAEEEKAVETAKIVAENAKSTKDKEEAKEVVKLAEDKKETPSGVKLENANNMDIPYPDLGGHTVSQLSQFQEHKRKSILGANDAEFCKKYHI